MMSISAEYKEIMNNKKQRIKAMKERVVDAYETEDFIIIVSISRNHIVYEHSFFKSRGIKSSWDIRIMSSI